MQYNVAQLLQEPIGSTRTYSVDEKFTASHECPVERAIGQFVFMRTDKGVLATAHLEAQMWNTCSRCLVDFSHALAVDFEEEYLSAVDPHTGKPMVTSEKPEWALTIDEGRLLNLGEAVRQHCIANGSMKPLCQPDCLGLCSSCGGDRNQGMCICKSSAVEHRWGPLRELLKRGS